MINGTYGIYKGEVHRIGSSKDEILLFPNSDSEIDGTYIDRNRLGIYSKAVVPEEISEAYSLLSYADYKGYKIDIARETADEYELYISDYELAKKLGFGRCDKYGYNLMVKKADVKVIVEKTPIDLEKVASDKKTARTNRSLFGRAAAKKRAKGIK